MLKCCILFCGFGIWDNNLLKPARICSKLSKCFCTCASKGSVALIKRFKGVKNHKNLFYFIAFTKQIEL